MRKALAISAIAAGLLVGSLALAGPESVRLIENGLWGGGTVTGNITLSPSTVQLRWSDLRLKDLSGILYIRDTSDADSASVVARDVFSVAGGNEGAVVRSTGIVEMTSGAHIELAAGASALGAKDTGMKKGSLAGTWAITDGASVTYGEVREMLLAPAVSVNWNTGTKTTLYTVPTGKSAIITRVGYRGASASATTASCGVGFDAGGVNVIASATHVALTGSTLYSVDSAKAGAAIGTAASVLGQVCTILQGGALTVTADVYGYLF